MINTLFHQGVPCPFLSLESTYSVKVYQSHNCIYIIGQDYVHNMYIWGGCVINIDIHKRADKLLCCILWFQYVKYIYANHVSQ